MNGLSVRQWMSVFRHFMTMFGMLLAMYGWFEPEASREWVHIFLMILGLFLISASMVWAASTNGLHPITFALAQEEIVKEICLDRRDPESSELAKLSSKITLR